MQSRGRNIDAHDATNILHVVEAWGGGVSAVVEAYSLALPNHNHRYCVRERVGFKTTDLVESKNRTESLIGFYIKAFKEIAKSRDTIIFLHSSLAGLFRLAFPFKKNVVYAPHCFAFERVDIGAVKRGLFRLVEFFLAKSKATTLVLSPWEAELARKLRSNRVRLVPNAVRVPVLEINRENSIRRIGMIGRICTQKDPDFFAVVARQMPEYEFVWVGDGDAQLTQMLWEAGVKVTGWLAPQEIMNELNNLDLVLHSAKWEGSPLTLLEAISAGVPVIAREIPSLESLGYYSAGPDPMQSAEKILLLSRSAPEWMELINSCKRIIEENSKVMQERALQELLESIG